VTLQLREFSLARRKLTLHKRSSSRDKAAGDAMACGIVEDAPPFGTAIIAPLAGNTLKGVISFQQGEDNRALLEVKLTTSRPGHTAWWSTSSPIARMRLGRGWASRIIRKTIPWSRNPTTDGRSRGETWAPSPPTTAGRSPTRTFRAPPHQRQPAHDPRPSHRRGIPRTGFHIGQAPPLGLRHRHWILINLYPCDFRHRSGSPTSRQQSDRPKAPLLG
jgi:hypothetical protein